MSTLSRPVPLQDMRSSYALTRPAPARSLHFGRLPRLVQERFLDAVHERFPPSPVVFARSKSVPVRWMALAFAAASVFVALVAYGFGAPGSPAMNQPWSVVPVYVALLGVVASAFVRAFRERVVIAKLPYPAGVYVFPTSLVDARGPRLRVHSLSTLARMRVASAWGRPRIELQFEDGAWFSFEYADAGQARRAFERLETARLRVEEEAQSLSSAGLQAIFDPLADLPLDFPLRDSEPPLGAPTAPPTALTTTWALIACTALALIVWQARNAASESRAYDAVVASSDPGVLASFAARAPAHRDEVERELLPRALLREALAAGSIVALESLGATYPSLRPEIAAARTDVLRAELAAARGSLPALRLFSERYPDHGLDEELKAAFRSVYDMALGRQVVGDPSAATPRIGGGTAPSLTEAFESLLVATEPRTMALRVRFAVRPSTSLARADREVAASPRFAGAISEPAQYLEAPLPDGVRASFVDALKSAVDKRLGASTITVTSEAAQPLDADSSVPAHTSEPTLWIVMQPEWTGMLHESRDPPAVFAEVGCAFEVVLTSPIDGPTPSVRKLIVPGLPRNELGAARGLGAGSARNAARIEERVYSAIIRDAYARLGRLVVDGLIGDGALGP